MAIADLSNVLNIFRGTETSAEDKDELFKEVMLMTLARATSSDANIDPCEVTTVQKILKAHTGDDIHRCRHSAGLAPHALRRSPFRQIPEQRAQTTRSLPHVLRLCEALAEVIKSDTEVRDLEIDFFNMVANELKATPAEIIGLSNV